MVKTNIISKLFKWFKNLTHSNEISRKVLIKMSDKLLSFKHLVNKILRMLKMKTNILTKILFSLEISLKVWIMAKFRISSLRSRTLNSFKRLINQIKKKLIHKLSPTGLNFKIWIQARIRYINKQEVNSPQIPTIKTKSQLLITSITVALASKIKYYLK